MLSRKRFYLSVLYLASTALIAGSGVPAGAAGAGDILFQKGLTDRQVWEEWFGSLQGDIKTGAFYWASQRSLPHPGSCQQMDDDFFRGCTDAKERLAAPDELRRTEPQYKAGWNAWAAATKPNTSSEPQITTPAADAAPPTTPSQVISRSGRWYIARLGEETCVPLDDIADDTTRLYYGTGNMRSPEDFARHARSVGLYLREINTTNQPSGIVIYAGHTTGSKAETEFVFFDNPGSCKGMMSLIDK